MVTAAAMAAAAAATTATATAPPERTLRGTIPRSLRVSRAPAAESRLPPPPRALLRTLLLLFLLLLLLLFLLLLLLLLPPPLPLPPPPPLVLFQLQIDSLPPRRAPTTALPTSSRPCKSQEAPAPRPPVLFSALAPAPAPAPAPAAAPAAAVDSPVTTLLPAVPFLTVPSSSLPLAAAPPLAPHLLAARHGRRPGGSPGGDRPRHCRSERSSRRAGPGLRQTAGRRGWSLGGPSGGSRARSGGRAGGLARGSLPRRPTPDWFIRTVQSFVWSVIDHPSSYLIRR